MPSNAKLNKSENKSDKVLKMLNAKSKKISEIALRMSEDAKEKEQLNAEKLENNAPNKLKDVKELQTENVLKEKLKEKSKKLLRRPLKLKKMLNKVLSKQRKLLKKRQKLSLKEPSK